MKAVKQVKNLLIAASIALSASISATLPQPILILNNIGKVYRLRKKKLYMKNGMHKVQQMTPAQKEMYMQKPKHIGINCPISKKWLCVIIWQKNGIVLNNTESKPLCINSKQLGKKMTPEQKQKLSENIANK